MNSLKGIIAILLILVLLSFVIRYLWPIVLLMVIYGGIQWYRIQKQVKDASKQEEETTFQSLQQDLLYEQIKEKELEGEIIDAEFEEKGK